MFWKFLCSSRICIRVITYTYERRLRVVGFLPTRDALFGLYVLIFWVGNWGSLTVCDEARKLGGRLCDLWLLLPVTVITFVTWLWHTVLKFMVCYFNRVYVSELTAEQLTWTFRRWSALGWDIIKAMTFTIKTIYRHYVVNFIFSLFRTVHSRAISAFRIIHDSLWGENNQGKL